MKVLICGGYARSLVRFRGNLIATIREDNHEVLVCAPQGDEFVTSFLSQRGVCFKVVPLRRTGINPVADLLYLRALCGVMRDFSPDVVLAYTHKPVIYAAMATKYMIKKPAVFSLITGLGYGFTESDSVKGRMVGGAMRFLYRRASRRMSGVIFQNSDDQAFFRERRMISCKIPQCVVRGSGVDLSEYNYVPSVRAGYSSALSFVLIGRLLGSKGVREYVSAARYVQGRYSNVSFYLVGPEDSNPTGISCKEVKSWQDEGVICYHGAQEDVRKFLRECSVFVLPSYREGTPRTVLEAMATGRAVITTDAPGCRETIFDAGPADDSGRIRTGLNGMLVPARSVEALAEAMIRFVRQPDVAETMGREGRRLAEEHYDVNKVNRQMLKFMDLLPRD